MRPENYDNLNKNITKVLKSIITDKGLSITRIATEMAYSSSDLYKHFNGHRNWTLYILYLICENLEITLSSVIIQAEKCGPNEYLQGQNRTTFGIHK